MSDIAPLLAQIYCTAIAGIIVFQVLLILGAPWGRITQGGTQEGALPVWGRVIAGLSILILGAMAAAMLSAAGLYPAWPRWSGWAGVGVTGISFVLNVITPSRAERRIWAPVMGVLFALALSIMLV